MSDERTLSAFSKFIRREFRGLQTLTSELNLFPIDFIASKPNLQRLRYPAIATSDDDEVGAVFRTLPAIALEICRFTSQMDSVEDDWGHTTVVLQNISPLRSLTLFEQVESERATLAAEVFLDTELSIYRHKESLVTLKLLAEPHSSMSFNNLSRFLSSSYLTYIEYSDSYCPIYNHLPATTETIVWRLDRSNTERDESLASRIKNLVNRAMVLAKGPAPAGSVEHKLPHLKDITICLNPSISIQDSDDDDDDDYDDDDDDNDSPDEVLERARSILRTIGIRLTWMVWDLRDGL